MALTRCQPVALSSPYGPVFKLDSQSSTPPAPSDAMALSSAAGQVIDLTIDDDDGLPLPSEIPGPSRQVIDLTVDEDDGDGDGDKVAEVRWSGNGRPARRHVRLILYPLVDRLGIVDQLPSTPLRPSSLQKCPTHSVDATVATHGSKKYSWKNVPSCSLLHNRLQQHSTTSLPSLTVDTFHAGLDSLGSTSTESAPPPTDFTAPTAEQADILPEIPETPAVTLENVRREEDDHSEGGNDDDYRERVKLSPGPRWSPTTTTMSMIEILQRHPAETAIPQRADQIETIINTDGLNKAPSSIAKSSDQTLFPAIASSSSLLDLGDGGLTVIDIIKFTSVKIFDKRSGPSGVKYECEVGRVWLAAKLVQKVSGGCVRIRTYKDGII